MIPILYESAETNFESNGLHRLRDCLRCEVTEERNGIYEVEFDYPVDGQWFDEIIPGRIIAVEHDKTGDVQPFDIYGHEKPINGIVTFRAQHICYRLRGQTVYSANTINTISGVITALQHSIPYNDFSFYSDKTGTALVSAATRNPVNAKDFLGGVEGSVLDAFGGEYEYDKFDVRLWKARGKEANFTIRYGVNMTEYNDQLDYSETYNSCVPFWRGTNDNNQEVLIVGSEVSSGYISYDGHPHCSPLDLTDKFETAPEVSDLESKAESYMGSNQTYLPRQTISVNFIMLEDTEELKRFANLQKLRLCDTVKVEFPRYGMSGKYKIVKVVWDVLGERYKEMELGTLSISLAEALGLKR